MLKSFYQLVFLFGFFYLGLLAFLSFRNYESMKLDPLAYSNTGYALLYSAVFYLLVFIGSLYWWREKKVDPKESAANLLKSKDSMPWENIQNELNEPLIDKSN